jgi:hypothetical protein
LIVAEPHPISEVIGACTVEGTEYELRRGLLSTLDAARKRDAGLVVLATLQVAWYEKIYGKAPASCQKTLALAKEAAR